MDDPNLAKIAGVFVDLFCFIGNNTMAHKHFCYVGGHHYECSKPECMCICEFPLEDGDHSDCSIELHACPKHEKGISPAELAAVQEGGAVEIQFPTNLPEVLRQMAKNDKSYGAFCIWCGSGYTYTRKLQAEHFAYNCPEAPEGLKEHMRLVLTSHATKGKKRCRKSKSSLK